MVNVPPPVDRDVFHCQRPRVAVLHGVGEPMLVKNLPRMVRYLKNRGTYVLFNTNGTVLNEKMAVL